MKDPTLDIINTLIDILSPRQGRETVEQAKALGLDELNRRREELRELYPDGVKAVDEILDEYQTEIGRAFYCATRWVSTMPESLRDYTYDRLKSIFKSGALSIDEQRELIANVRARRAAAKV